MAFGELRTLTFDLDLNLSEYEVSVILGALTEFGEKWEDDRHTAVSLHEQIDEQLPDEWRDS